MNREFIITLVKQSVAPFIKGFLGIGFFSLALLFFLTGTAVAKGGDPVTPFPVIDGQPGKQEAKAMAMDSGGNIIVVGYTNVSGMNNDYRVVKYTANGSSIAWRATPDFDKSGGDDQATAVVVDKADNIIVTGTVWNASTIDIHTIKYSGVDGAVLWQHTWSGPGGGADIATALAVDGDNNIYVAGYTANGSGHDDYLIIKYPAAGAVPSWVEIWDSGYHSNDRIAAIAAGTDGLVVTGASSKGGTDFDILTRKYAFDKTLIWEQRRASSGSGDDRGVTVRMDPSGNVLVAGYLANVVNSDMITIKYAAAAPGGSIWETIYNGGNNDEARALWVDASGDIFVTGYTYTYSGNEDVYTVRYGSLDGAVVWEKIYDSGNDFTDVPVGIVVKGGVDGDVYITGYTTTSLNENVTTLKYKKSNGELIWQKSYNGPANKSERPVGIDLDSTGEVCVAGWSDTAANLYDFIVIKYDYGRIDPPTRLTAAATSNTSITINWTDNSSNESGFKIERKEGESGSYAQFTTVGPNITTYNDSTPPLTPNIYYYYRVRAYNATDGNSAYSNEAHALTKVVNYDAPAWIYQYNGADNREDEAVAIVTGADNHPVVTGFTDLTEAGVEGTYSFDYMTFKLDRLDSSIIWKARYDSGDGGTDMAAGVAIDTGGNAIVTGTAYLSGGSDKSDDLFTIKYNSAGYTDPLTNPPVAWGEQYGTQAGIDQATAVQTAKDASNNLVVIGHGINAANDEDMFIIKYRPDGTSPWAPIVFDGGTSGNDYPSAVAFDAAGNIFITGSTENAAGNFDIYTAKYSGASGALIWSDIYAGAGNGDDHGLSLAVDKAGNVYVAGHAVNAAGNDEWVTIKYDGADVSSTRRLWPEVRVHNGLAAPVNGNDRAVSIALDPISGDTNPMKGEVIVAGTSYRTATDSDFHLIRYKAADGAIVWERNFDRPTKYDYLTAMAVDSSGYIYLTGNSRNGLDTDPAFDSSSDILSLIYSFEGTFLSASEYNGSRMDEARAIAANYQGEAFSAGVTKNASNPDYLVLKHKNNYILVPAPFAAIPQPDYHTMLLTWGANTPGTQFRLERTLAPVLDTSIWDVVTTTPVGTTSYLDSGLTAATGYCYSIYAFLGGLDSRTIVTCATTTLVAPTLYPLAVDSTTQITLNWSQVVGNTGYKIERKIGAGGNWDELVTKTADITTHADSGLTPGTTYYYRVSANSPPGYSLAGEQSALTKPVAPLLNNPTNITNTQMLLGWDTITGAASYTLQSKQSGGSYADFGPCTDIAATSCTVTGLVNATDYTFRVLAKNSGGLSAWSNETSGTARLAVPTLAAPTAITTTSMTLSWTNPVVPGANVTSYTLEKREGVGGTFVPSGCPVNTNLSCNVTGLTPNRVYYFHVKATNAAGSSDWSSEQSGTTPLPATTLAQPLGVSTSQVSLSWDAVPEATGYTVQKSECYPQYEPASCDGTVNRYSAMSNVASVTGTSVTADNLLAGKNYLFQVKATVGTNSSAYSPAKSAWTWLTPRTLQPITALSTTSLKVDWVDDIGETNYTVEVSTSGINGPYTPIPAGTGLPIHTATFTHSGLALDSLYCYQVKAYSTVALAPPDAYNAPLNKCKTTPPAEPVSSLGTTELSSAYTVLQDTSKNWNQADYFIGQPVVITSGGNTYTRTIAGSTNSAFYVSPPFTSETISQGDSYVILQTVSGKATGNDGGGLSSLIDSEKAWSLNEWLNYKIKILNSVNSTNIGLERTIGLNGTTNPYTTVNFNAAIVAGDTYQIASFFGAATAGSTTQLTHASNTWGASVWTGSYLLMTSGANSGQARKINNQTATTLTTDPFPVANAAGDSYLIAPPAKMASYFGTATGAGSSTTQLVDTVHVWQGNYTGSYLLMTSGSNMNNVRLITSAFDSGGKLTVSPPFESAITAGNNYVMVSAAQLIAYAGGAVGSPGSSKTELVDTANSWLTDWSQGYYLQMTSGSNIGQSRLITAKTATTLTVSAPFSNNIIDTDDYIIWRAAATSSSGNITTTVAPAAAYNGKAKLTLTSSSAEFDTTSPGYANNYNYGLLSLKNLVPLSGTFDSQFDYTVTSGLIPADSSLNYLYLPNYYAAARLDFQSPAGKGYQGHIIRGRVAPQDNGRTTAWSATLDTLYDTRTMVGSATAWKSWWATDQWKDYYLQMTSGPNNQLVRKVTANTVNSITLESPFPADPAAVSGTAAASGNSQTKLVDSAITTWGVNQWQNYYLHMVSGVNAGQTRKIISSDASSVTVEAAGFTQAIGSGDSYRMFTSSGDSYRFNVIAGNAAILGNTQDFNNSSNAVLVDSSANNGSTLPPKNWGINQWSGFHLYLSSGPNIGQFRTITANTANSISVDPPFPYQIASSDSYTIFDPRPAAQAGESYWVTLYDPVTNVSEVRIFPTSDASGKFRVERSGNSMKFYTSPATLSWTLRRQLDLSAGDPFIPGFYWMYQLGRLPHTAGTTIKTTVSNFLFNTPAATVAPINASYWTAEVGHNFRRLTLTANPVELSWTRLNTALSYETERCQSNNHNVPAGRTINAGLCTTSTQAQPIDGTTRIVSSAANSGLEAGYTYRFRVRAKYGSNADDYTAWSNEQWLTITPPAPVMVAPTAASATATSLTPTWNDVPGDNGYKLYWKIRTGASCSDDSWSGPLTPTINVATYNHTGLTSGTYYCYKIAATGPAGPPVTPNSAFSAIVSQTTKPAAPGALTFSGHTTTTVTVNWGTSIGNTEYLIERSIDSTNWVTAGTAVKDATSFPVSGLSAGTLYYFRVSANSAAGYSTTTSGSTTTKPVAPVITATVISSAQINITWPVVLGASSYKLERKKGTDSYSLKDTVAIAYSQLYCDATYPTVACPNLTPITAIYADSGLSANTTYCYRMQAGNSSGGDSAYSGEKCVTTPLMVESQNLTVTPVNAFVIRLNWTPLCSTPPCTVPEGFIVERMIRDGIWVEIAVVGPLATSFTDRIAIDPIKQYRYRVRSFSGQSLSPYVEGMTFTPPYKAGDNVGP
jgi:uncharacterized delta-60 repeat protein